MANGLALGIDKGYKTEKTEKKPKAARRKGVSERTTVDQQLINK